MFRSLHPIVLAAGESLVPAFSGTSGIDSAQDGTFRVTAQIGDKDGDSASVSTTNIVAHAPITAPGAAVHANRNGVVSRAVVARFNDPNPNLKSASAFSATINWGDGQTSAGTIVRASDGSFRVRGSHRSSGPGAFAVSTTIQQGQSAVTTFYTVVNRISDGAVAADHVVVKLRELVGRGRSQLERLLGRQQPLRDHHGLRQPGQREPGPAGGDHPAAVRGHGPLGADGRGLQQHLGVSRQRRDDERPRRVHLRHRGRYDRRLEPDGRHRRSIAAVHTRRAGGGNRPGCPRSRRASLSWVSTWLQPPSPRWVARRSFAAAAASPGFALAYVKPQSRKARSSVSAGWVLSNQARARRTRSFTASGFASAP
jgi:hypothetical protein